MIIYSNSMCPQVGIWRMLRGRYTRMSCLRLTNTQHSKNCFARERTEKATIITTKKRDFHHIKKRTLAVQRCFYFSISFIRRTITIFGTIRTYKCRHQKNKNNVAQPKFSFLVMTVVFPVLSRAKQFLLCCT